MVDVLSISFLVAFVGGLLSIVSPCILPILPAFFAYNFKEKKEITRMTFSFFLGFAIIFILMGLVASFIGQMFEAYKELLILFAGIMLVVFAVMIFLGKGFSFIKFNRKMRSDRFGVFLFGVFFGIGWTPCLGPILAGILFIASTLPILHSAGLLFVYSLGIFIPFFLISFMFDKYDLSKVSWIRGKGITFKILNREIKVHSSNLISAILLLVMGLIFIFYRGTYVINNLDLLGTRDLFFKLQDKLAPSIIIKLIGILVLIVFGILLWRFLKKGRAKNEIRRFCLYC